MGKRRRGQQPAPQYVTSWGERINAYLSSDGRLRPCGRSSPAFGPAGDEQLAVHRFKMWAAKNGMTEVTAPIQSYAEARVMSEMGLITSKEKIRATIQIEVYKEKMRIRNLILTDPKAAALDMDIPHLAYYPEKPDKPEFTLEELGKHYLDNKRGETGKALHPKYRENTERAWNDFVKTVAVRYARDITQTAVQQYNAGIMVEFDKGKSPAWVRTRFQAVKTILKYGLEYSRDKADYRAALDECAILKAPAERADPKPISVDHFHLLFDNASPRERAMLLMGLNMAGHGGEVCGLKKAEVDLEKGTLSCRRSKNGYPRVAALWPRTVQAIREYLAANPNESPYLFVSGTGKAMTSEALRQRIVAIRQKLNKDHQEKTGTPDAILIPATVTFDGLRDAAFGEAEKTDHHHAKFIAGHKTGMSDKYVLRQADNPNVIACCEAIERHFFPDKAFRKKIAGRKSKPAERS